MFEHRGHGARRRVERLERPHRCPVHPDEWLVCVDDVLDVTRLTDAERTELDALIDRIPGAVIGGHVPHNRPCPRCGEPRSCLACTAEAEVRESVLTGFSEPERARILDLTGKAIRDAWGRWTCGAGRKRPCD